MDKLKACFCFGIMDDAQGVMSGPELKSDEENNNNRHIISVFEEKIRKKEKILKKPAIHFAENNILTFNQLNTFASCLSKSIAERLGYDYKIENPDTEMVIAICLPMSEKTIALILGILKTGAAYLPLDPQFPEKLLLEIINTVKPIMLITDDNGKIFNKYDSDRFLAASGMLVSVEELWLDVEFAKEPKTRRASLELPWEIEFLHNKDKDPALLPVGIFYSHGLRDNPVGVRVCSRSILNLVTHMWSKFGVIKNDQCCFTVSVASPYSLPQIFIPLLQGCTLHVFRRADLYDSDKFVKNLSWRNITLLSIPTHSLKDIIDTVENIGSSKILKRLKLVICRGALISPETAEAFFDVFKSGVTLANCVGTLETTCDAAFEMYNSRKDYDSKLINGIPSLSSVMCGTKIYLVDEHMKLVPDGKHGQFYVSGVCLALGYVNHGAIGDKNTFLRWNPFSSSSNYDRLHKTGEYGRIMKTADRKRHLVMEGRNDTLIKVHGHIFSTSEVEVFLKQLEKVQDAYCFVYEAGTSTQQFLGFLVLEPKVIPDETFQGECAFILRNKLPDWAIPDELFVIKRIPYCTCTPKIRDVCPQCLLKATLKEESSRRPSAQPSKFTLKTGKSNVKLN